MELLKVLNERYATKKMNGQVVPEDKVEAIIEAARMAPTSSGLQPFKVIVITNKELKEKIVTISFNQTQVVDCSHLLVFAAWDNYTTERITQMLDYTVDQRGLPVGTMDDYKNRLLSIYGTRDAELNFIHAAHQSYIAFGMAIAAAGCGIAQGMGLKAACEGTARNPEAGGKLMVTLILGLAFIESLAIYALVINLILLFVNPLGK